MTEPSVIYETNETSGVHKYMSNIFLLESSSASAIHQTSVQVILMTILFTCPLTTNPITDFQK